jgi:hypothetical protein
MHLGGPSPLARRPAGSVLILPFQGRLLPLKQRVSEWRRAATILPSDREDLPEPPEKDERDDGDEPGATTFQHADPGDASER